MWSQIEALERLWSLRERGALTDAEYDGLKTDLIVGARAYGSPTIFRERRRNDAPPSWREPVLAVVAVLAVFVAGVCLWAGYTEPQPSRGETVAFKPVRVPAADVYSSLPAR